MKIHWKKYDKFVQKRSIEDILMLDIFHNL